VTESLVSIVLPVYNGSVSLAEAVESCLNQSHGNLELIIVDDASTDNTPEIISDYASQDNRVRPIRHDTNKRLPAALNSGFDVARGELLTWTSHDNLYRPLAVATMANFLEANPDVDVVYAGYTFIDSDGNILGRMTAPPPEELPYWNAVGACFLYRRSLHEILGNYDVTCFLVEDYEYWLRAVDSFRFHALQEDLYLYRVHDESLSHRQLEFTKLTVVRLLERCLAEKNWGPDHRAMAHLRLAREKAALNDSRSAWNHLLRGVQASPVAVFSKLGLIVSAFLLLGPTKFGKLKSRVKDPLSARHG
jgi:glycosyltransferase involved in cell wall biosynthesis